VTAYEREYIGNIAARIVAKAGPVARGAPDDLSKTCYAQLGENGFRYEHVRLLRQCSRLGNADFQECVDVVAAMVGDATLQASNSALTRCVSHLLLGDARVDSLGAATRKNTVALPELLDSCHGGVVGSTSLRDSVFVTYCASDGVALFDRGILGGDANSCIVAWFEPRNLLRAFMPDVASTDVFVSRTVRRTNPLDPDSGIAVIFTEQCLTDLIRYAMPAVYGGFFAQLVGTINTDLAADIVSSEYFCGSALEGAVLPVGVFVVCAVKPFVKDEQQKMVEHANLLQVGKSGLTDLTPHITAS
jgi:hypothetical protein